MVEPAANIIEGYLRDGVAQGGSQSSLGAGLEGAENRLEFGNALFNRIKVYALVDFKVGNKIFNNTFGYRCQTRNSCFENVQPLQADPVDVAVAQSNRVYWNTYLQDASFAKLREVSVSYTLPERWARRMGATAARVTVSGRNLHTWSSYPGIDPELSFLVDQFTRTEQTNTPPLAQLNVAATLTF